MYNKQAVLNEIDMVSTLKVVTQAYQEISVIRMQKIRGSVVKTRDYMVDLSDVFYDVKSAYQQQIKLLSKHKKNGPGLTSFSTLNKNGKSISIFLSPNTRLQGGIIAAVFDLFLEKTKNTNDDLMIIGKVGKDMYEDSGQTKPYLYFEVPESDVNIEDSRPIIFNIIKYETVNVYHERFENIVNQLPVSTNVSGDQAFDEDIEAVHSNQRFLFEPSLFKIMNFFETQIFSSLFKQSIYESQLAQFASRINAMGEAIQNIEKNTTILQAEKRKINRMINDRKQLNTLSGISLWK